MRLGAPASVALGFLASLGIELAQLTGLFGVYPYAYRTFETTDLATNTLGALCGWLLARASLRALPDPGRLAPAAVTSSPGIVRRAVAFCIDTALAATASAIAGSGLLLVFCALGGAPASAAALPGLALLGTASVLAVEVAVPWRRGGRTPGGAFVRMTCETRERQGARRVAFYAARTLVILCAVGLPGIEPRLTLVPLACLAFYLFKREMICIVFRTRGL